MKIIEQFIVSKDSQWHLLLHLEGGAWFMTTNGGFGLGGMHITQIQESEAQKLISLMEGSTPTKI